MDILNKTNIQREGSYETKVSILVLGRSGLGGWGWPLTLGLKANIWGSLGSTTEGYGSKMTTFLGDSNADLHMDTNKSTTLKIMGDESLTVSSGCLSCSWQHDIMRMSQVCHPPLRSVLHAFIPNLAKRDHWFKITSMCCLWLLMSLSVSVMSTQCVMALLWIIW